MKNEKGTGSVYKMKDKKRRKPWRAVSPGIRNKITGKLERVNIGMYETKQEALEALLGYNKNPYSLDTKKLTFLDVANRWKEEHLPKVGKHRTKGILTTLKSFAPLYNLIFTDIKLIDLQNFFNHSDLSSGTKSMHKSIINLIFEYGRKYEIIDKNLVSFVDIGKNEKVREAKIFNSEEISILQKYQLYKEVDTILILIYTGLRINELLELKKENIFLEERYLIAGSKTAAGKDRLIPIHKDLIPLIKRRYEESNYYLIELNDKKMEYMTYRKRYLKLLEYLNLEKHTIHDTRHTFATIMNNSGANSTSIKNIIGHSDFKTTEKIYTHKEKAELIKAIDLVNLKEA